MREQLTELARRNNLIIFADETYDKLRLAGSGDDAEKDRICEWK
jgi:hypothetical protein